MKTRNILILIALFVVAVFMHPQRNKDVPVAEGAIFVGSKGAISANNGTTTPLVALDTFEGTGENIYRMSQITVFYDTDVPSATDGIQFQFSTDNTNWDRIVKISAEADEAHSSGYGGVHTFPVVAQYFRIVYINGASNQGTFRLQTIYHPSKNLGETYRADQTINSASDVDLVRLANDVDYDRNASLNASQSISHYVGISDTISVGPEHVWAGDGVFVHPDTAHFFRIQAGGNPADTIGGAGAQTLEIIYLDSLWALAIDTLIFKGSAVSDSSLVKGIRLLEAEVLNCGSYGGSNIGGVTIENTIGEVVGFISAGSGRLHQALYSVEAGKKAYIYNLDPNPTDAVSANVIFIKRENADDVTPPFTSTQIMAAYLDIKGDNPVDRNKWIELPEKSDFYVVASKAVGTGETRVTVEFDVLLVDN